MAEDKAKAKAEKEAKAKAEAEEKAKAKAEEKARAKAEVEEKARAKAEEKARAKAEAEEKARAKAEEKARAKAEAEEKAKAFAEEIAKAIAAAEEKAEAGVKAEAEAGVKAEAEAEEKAKLRMPKLRMPKMPSLSIGGGAADKRIISLSIEGTELRVLSFYRNSVESWASVPFSADLLRVGQVADSEGFAGVIKSALADEALVNSRVVCAIPGLRTMSRIIGLPKVSKAELDAAVSREARRLMAISLEENNIYWQTLTTKTDEMQIFVLVVPKEPIDDFIAALQEAGIMAHAIDLKPLALVRAVNKQDAIIVNGESNSMELVIVVDDVPVLMRSVFLGEGVVSEDYAVGRIGDELGRTIAFYNESNIDNPLDPEVPVYFTGAVASGLPFALNVSALIGRPAQPLDPPLAYPEGFPVAEFMVNMGLILKIL